MEENPQRNQVTINMLAAATRQITHEETHPSFFMRLSFLQENESGPQKIGDP